MSTDLRKFPFSNRLVVAAGIGRVARTTSALAGSSDWRRRLADLVGGFAIALVGPRVLPRVAPWPWPALDPGELVSEFRKELPGFELIGVSLPRQQGRRRLSVLGRSGGALTVIKIGSTETDGSLATEALVLRLLRINPLPGIATPEVLATGELPSTDGHPVSFVATTAVSARTQRPAVDAPLRTFEADLGARLADLPRPDDSPADSVPIHGDLTPWNLRRTSRGLALFDWESARWGPAGYDVATYRRTCNELTAQWRPRKHIA